MVDLAAGGSEALSGAWLLAPREAERGVESQPAATFLRRLIEVTATAISPGAFTGKQAAPVYALSIVRRARKSV